MSFDRQTLVDCCATHGLVARIAIANVRGSAPRETGASMLVWRDGQAGTIGGGVLEFELAKRARMSMASGSYLLTHHALGPEMGQCCGGAVDVVTEVFDVERAHALSSDVIARGPGQMPLAVRRLLGQARREGNPLLPQLISGWFVEPVSKPSRSIWIWGAGHVGRAIVQTFAPLPQFAITWVDTAEARFPESIPPNVTKLVASAPAALAAYAPEDTEHFILTYSHEIDLELCHALLSRGFRSAGLIGSKTKWARFRKRLAALGHTPNRIDKITCPIGDPHLGKHPQAIAIGVATQMLQNTLRLEAAPKEFFA